MAGAHREAPDPERTKALNIRMTPALWKRIQDSAKRLECSATEFIRRAVEDFCERVGPAEKKQQ
jgi:predicted transcriptional regulator